MFLPLRELIFVRCKDIPRLLYRCNFVFCTFRRRHTADGSDSSQSQGRLQQQQLAPMQDSYMQNRAEALHNVESTIVELSNIFTQLSTMVAQQGEVAIRYAVLIKPPLPIIWVVLMRASV